MPSRGLGTGVQSTRSVRTGKAAPPRAREVGVDVGVQDLLAARPPRRRPCPAGRHDGAPAHVAPSCVPALLQATTQRLVLDRAGPGEHRPVLDARGRPARRHEERLGAGVDEAAVELGEAQVVAGREPGGAERRRQHDERRRPRSSPTARRRPSRTGAACGRSRGRRRRGRSRPRCCTGARRRARRTSPCAARSRPSRAAAAHPRDERDRRSARRLALRALEVERAHVPQLGQHGEVDVGEPLHHPGRALDAVRRPSRCRSRRAG